jgi:hypothetical protein
MMEGIGDHRNTLSPELIETGTGIGTQPYSRAILPCKGILNLADQPAVSKKLVNLIPQSIININETEDLMFEIPGEPVKKAFREANRLRQIVFFPKDHH